MDIVRQWLNWKYGIIFLQSRFMLTSERRTFRLKCFSVGRFLRRTEFCHDTPTQCNAVRTHLKKFLNKRNWREIGHVKRKLSNVFPRSIPQIALLWSIWDSVTFSKEINDSRFAFTSFSHPFQFKIFRYLKQCKFYSSRSSAYHISLWPL